MNRVRKIRTPARFLLLSKASSERFPLQCPVDNVLPGRKCGKLSISNTARNKNAFISLIQILFNETIVSKTEVGVNLSNGAPDSIKTQQEFYYFPSLSKAAETKQKKLS